MDKRTENIMKVTKVLKWREQKQSLVDQVTQDELNILPAILPDGLYLREFCFIITTMFVFILSLAIALSVLECYKYYKRSKMFLIIRDKCNHPPSYDTVVKIDKTSLPSYDQACHVNIL